MTSLLLALLALGPGDPEPAIPLSLKDAEPPAAFAEEGQKGWWLGGRAGYIKAKDADNGTWVVGAQLRWHILEFFAVEGSVEFREDEFNNGDIEVFTIPVQISALLYLPLGGFRPYALAGVGWYISRTDFKGALGNLNDETENSFGVHLGAGLELVLSHGFSIDADFRYIFIDEPDLFGNNNFDSWEATIGLNFRL